MAFPDLIIQALEAGGATVRCECVCVCGGGGGGYSPISTMVNHEKVSLFEQSRRIITQILTNAINLVLINMS